MRQLFKIGEEVSVVSKYYPNISGDYIIEAVTNNQCAKIYTCTITGSMIKSLGEPAYSLAGLVIEGNETGMPLHWVGQSSIRKKHQPGEDFKSLMSSLNKVTA